MLPFFILLLFIFLFWIIHIIRRILEQTSLWQKSKYKWVNLKKPFSKKSFFSKQNLPMIISVILAISGVILLKGIKYRSLYIIILIGFAYYVYSALSSLTSLLSPKGQRPTKRKRNLFIVIASVAVMLTPLILTLVFYRSLYVESSSLATESTGVEDFFPRDEVEAGTPILYIPLETASVVLFFNYLFGFDLILPGIVGILTVLSSFFVKASAKKK